MMHERACCQDEAANHQLSTSAAFWSIQIVSAEECSSLTQNLMQICCSTQSCQMWQPHSTHTQTAGRLLPPLTSTVKSWLFMHVHSSPLSLAARLHWCRINLSCYINSGWNFFWTDLIFLTWGCSLIWKRDKGREREEERERQRNTYTHTHTHRNTHVRKKHWCEREIWIGWLPYVPWSGTKSAT